jgi:CTP synthase (UTP-ammonia lyase)
VSTMRSLRIGIIGDFDRGKHSHWATEAALFHAAARLGVSVEPCWLATTSLANDGANDSAQLADFDGIWGAPGSPFASPQGMLEGIEHARTRDVPYLGTCAGFQYALIELTRNVLGVPDADTAENAPGGANIVITPVRCAMPDSTSGAQALIGDGVVRPCAGTLLETLCGPGELRGEFHCSLEANADFVPRWERAGLRVAARGVDGEMRAFELPAKRFFLATLFRPQLSSSHQQPHPIVIGFLRAASP